MAMTQQLKPYMQRLIEWWQNNRIIAWVAVTCLAVGFIAGALDDIVRLISLVPRNPADAISVALNPYNLGWRYSPENGVSTVVGGGPFAYFTEYVRGPDGDSVDHRIWICDSSLVVNASVLYDAPSDAPPAVLNDVLAVIEPAPSAKHGYFSFGTGAGAASDLPGVVEGRIRCEHGSFPLRYWGRGEDAQKRVKHKSPPNEFLYLKPNEPMFLQAVLISEFSDYESAYIRLGLVVTMGAKQMTLFSRNRVRFIHKRFPYDAKDSFRDGRWVWLNDASPAVLKLAYQE